jgi:hypothetical protein
MFFRTVTVLLLVSLVTSSINANKSPDVERAEEHTIQKRSGIMDIAKEGLTIIVGEVPLPPGAASVIGALISLFWPSAQEDVWSKVSKQVDAKIDEKHAENLKLFFRGLKTNLIRVDDMGDSDPAKLTRLHALEVDMQNKEYEFKNFNKQDPFASLVEYAPYAVMRTGLLSEILRITRNNAQKTTARKLYVTTLAYYSAYVTIQAGEAAQWRMDQLKKCEAKISAKLLFTGRACYIKDEYLNKQYESHAPDAEQCGNWCAGIEAQLKAKVTTAMKAVLANVPLWVKEYKKVKADLLRVLAGNNDKNCAFLKGLYDYTGTIAVTKSGKTCAKWPLSSKDAFPFDEGKSENYCRVPSANLGGKSLAGKPFCFPEGRRGRPSRTPELCKPLPTCNGVSDHYGLRKK